MTIHDVLTNNIIYITEQINNGVSMFHISKEFQCNSGTVWYFLQEHNIETKYKRSENYGKQDQFKNEIISLFNNEKSAYQISKDLCLGKRTVLRWLKSWGYNTSKKRKLDPNKPTLKSRLSEVIELFTGGMNCGAIGRKLGYSGSQVYLLLNKHGFDTPKAKYDVDETFFDKIDTQEKAYVLGWFYSDGNVMPSGQIRICLCEKDVEILRHIRDIMKYTGPLYNKKARNSSLPQVELCINRQVLCKQLIKLGCVPNKSLKLKFPTEEQLPKYLHSHFVRGYFDGDGSVCRDVSIVGSLDFINTLKNILPCQITNIYPRYKDRDARLTAHQLHICRQSEVKKFYHWLYCEATIWLPRKRNKFPHRCLLGSL